jgi:RNA polymerase-binding transcription factor DksA
MRQLFSPREAKEASQRQTEERIQLLSFLTGEEARLKKSLNSLNDEFDATLRRQREVYAAEKDKMQEELSKLDADIHTRKEARRKLMEPIDAIEARAIAKEKQAEEVFAQAHEKLVSAQELIHKTTSKLTVLQEKEDILDSEKVNKALNKIAAGTYGIDDEGNEIPEERLRALPWADKSI